MDEPIETHEEQPQPPQPQVTTIRQVPIWAWANNTDQSAMLESRSDDPTKVRLVIHALNVDMKLNPEEVQQALTLLYPTE